jgi:4-amino-4-deoxy-L-arabinose transferase-like glycosyltransferase
LRAALAIIAGFTLLRALCALLVPLLQAESYYWLWSRELAWGYFDHPPGVAVTMLASRLLGDSTLGLRLGHVLLGSLGSWVCFLLYRRLVAPKAALASLLALSFAPFWFPFGVVATPEGPLLFFWSLALLLFHQAASRESIPWSLAAGAAAGLAILSKYNGALLFASFFLFLWLDPRRPLRRPHPYLALVTALVVWAPNLIWTAEHGGTTMGMPFRDGLVPDEAPKHLALLMLQPFALLTPLLAWAWLRQTAVGLRSGRLRDEPAFRLAVLACWVPFAAFGVVALVTEIHLQWVVPCFVTALPIALENLGRVGAGVSPRFLRASLATGGALLAALAIATPLALATARHEGPGEPEGLARLAVETRGWDELRERIDAEIEQRGAGRPVFLTAPGKHLAGHLEWLAGGRYPAQPLDRRRGKQFLIWERDRELVGWDALYVHKRHREKEDDLLRRSCRSVEELEPVTIEVGAEVRRFVLYWCHEFKGLQ